MACVMSEDESDRCDAQKINATNAIVVPLLVPQSVRKSIRPSVTMAIAEAEIEVHHQMAVLVLGMITPVRTKSRNR